MHPVIVLILLLFGAITPLHAQNVTVGCGAPGDPEASLAAYAPLFTSDDSAAVKYRTNNNLQRVSPTETVAVTDSATCARLAERASELLLSAAGDYWSNAEWETFSIRAGPYFYVYIFEVPVPGKVSGWYDFVLDAHTLDEIPTPYAFQN